MSKQRLRRSRSRCRAIWRGNAEKQRDVSPFAEWALDAVAGHHDVDDHDDDDNDNNHSEVTTTLFHRLGTTFDETCCDDRRLSSREIAVLSLYRLPVCGTRFVKTARAAFATLDDRAADLAEVYHCSVCTRESHVGCEIRNDEPWWRMVSRADSVLRDLLGRNHNDDVDDDEHRVLIRDVGEALRRRIVELWTAVIDASTVLSSRARRLAARLDRSRRLLESRNASAAYALRAYRLVAVRTVESIRQLEVNVQRLLRIDDNDDNDDDKQRREACTSDDLLAARRFFLHDNAAGDWSYLVDVAYGAYAAIRVLLENGGRAVELRSLVVGLRETGVRECLVAADSVFDVETFVRETVGELYQPMRVDDNDDNDVDYCMEKWLLNDVENKVFRSNQRNFKVDDRAWTDFSSWLFACNDTFKLTYLYAYLATTTCTDAIDERVARYAAMIRYKIRGCLCVPQQQQQPQQSPQPSRQFDFADLYKRVGEKSRLLDQHESRLNATLRQLDALHA